MCIKSYSKTNPSALAPATEIDSFYTSESAFKVKKGKTATTTVIPNARTAAPNGPIHNVRAAPAHTHTTRTICKIVIKKKRTHFITDSKF